MIFLTNIAMKKRWLTFLIVAIITGLAVWATLSLQMEMIPDIEFPVTSIMTVYPQAKPEIVMEEVTAKIEEALKDLKGVDNIVSTVSEGSTFTLALFNFGTNMDKTNQLIEERLASLDLPEQVRALPQLMPQLEQNPQLFALDINIMPIVMLSLTGNVSPVELEEIANQQIVPKVENIKGVYHVGIESSSGQQVLIDLSPSSLNERGLPLSAVAAGLMGREFNSISDIENSPLVPGVALKDLGIVSLGYSPASYISRTNGAVGVSISIMKDAEANTVTVANEVMDAIKDLEESLPANVKLHTVMDQSEYIENSIRDLARNAIIGFLLAIVVVVAFLKVFKPSIVTAISIPLSLLFGFLIMKLLGITINMLTLSAMAIVVGRVIDNSIVVLEGIFRRMQAGEPFRQAAVDGTRDVALPITSSTVATIVIFVPIIFVGGMVGEMFLPFALTMTAALLASLFVALMVIPPLSNFPLKMADKIETEMHWYQRVYMSVLKWAFSHKALTIAMVIVLFLGSFTLIPIIGTSFLPSMGEKMVTVEVVMPNDSNLTDTENALIEVEKVLLDHQEVRMVQSSAGASSSLFGNFMSMGSGSAGSTTMVFLDKKSDMEQVAEELRRSFSDLVPGVEITVTAGQAMGSQMTGGGLEITVRGDTYADLAAAAKNLLAELNDVDGIADLEIALATAEPKLDISMDPAKIIAAGLSMDQMTGIQQELMLLQMGGPVARTTVEGRKYDVYLNGLIQNLENIEDANDLRVGFPDSFKLSSIASVELGQQQTNIQRIDGKLAATITGSITAKNIGAVNMAVQNKIDLLTLPAGLEIKQGGTIEMMTESFSNMGIAIAAAVLLAYLVIAVTFRSIRVPIVIMISLPLASIGALLALLLSGQSLGMSAMMGVLMLVGIVLTNAIVLIDLAVRLIKQGMSVHDALLEAGTTRIRPILMTALTTMVAMFPLALGIGEGSIISAELATVVIGGLFSSTLLTLVVIPVFYVLFKGGRKLELKIKNNAASPE